MRISDWSSDVCSSDLEHFDAGHDRLAGIVDADDLDFLAYLHDSGLDATGHNGAATRDREDVFDRHQERLVQRTLRLRNPAVDRSHQLENRLLAAPVVAAVKSLHGQTGRASCWESVCQYG